MPRLTKPLLDAMESALNVSLSGAAFDGGDHNGENPEHFERALKWVNEQQERREVRLKRKA